ncbi:SAP domain-containing protein [Bacillus sp. SCS-153A]|uniref:SAP domain-containing protein n=1 Tax=Rossellomorea sedimentorum TaxID=3115294 RepID=UPI003906C228
MGILYFLKKLLSTDDTKPINQQTSEFSRKDSYSFDIDPILKKKLPIGLLPGEVFLIDWISGKSEDVNFPRYFETVYGINAPTSLKKLLNGGYVEETSVMDSLASLKLPELKEILNTKELKVSGKKAEVITRISENFTEDEVSSYINSRMIKRTAKGDKVLDEFYYIVPAHRNDSKDGVYNVASAIRFVSKLNYKPKNGDISWALFQKAYMEHAEDFKYGLMRNDIRHMAAQLEKENKFKDSLLHYLRVYILDLSGLCNSPRLEHPTIIMYDVPAKHQIKKLIEVLDYDKKELYELFVYTWDKTLPGLKYHYLTMEECFNCLENSLEDEDEKVKKSLFNAYEKLKKDMNDKSFREKYGLEFPFEY